VSRIDGMLRYDERCSLGPSPSVDQIEWLARRAGFRSLFNLNEEGEPGPTLSPNVEATWAHTYGMQHERVSLSRERLDPSCVDQFLWTMGAIEKPVYVHSAGGARAAALLTILLGLSQRSSGADAVRAAQARGLDCKSPLLERAVQAEIDRRSTEPATAS
jgi:protein tyrosine phosphatase (PTP) superfamily phosphohydrolase (DUF442 family)